MLYLNKRYIFLEHSNYFIWLQNNNAIKNFLRIFLMNTNKIVIAIVLFYI